MCVLVDLADKIEGLQTNIAIIEDYPVPSMPSENIGVVMVAPDPRTLYVRLLCENLIKVGVRTCCVSMSVGPKLLSLPFEIALARPRAGVLHLHWIEHLFRPRKLVLAWLALTTILMFLAFAKSVMRYKIVTTLHNHKPHEQLFPRTERVGFVTILRLSDAVIAHNIFTRVAASRLYGVKPERLEVIPHGTFVGLYKNDISQAEARQILGIDSDRTVFSFVGYLRLYKGLETLIHGFQQALQQNPNLHLVVAGKPVHERIVRELSHLGSENLTLIDRYLRDDEIQVVINAADFGVLPYEFDTTPASLFLFLSFGRAVVVSDIPPVREIVKEDFGILFRSGDPRSLSEAMLLAATMKGKAATMGRLAFQEASRNDWTSVAVKTRALYRKLTRVDCASRDDSTV